MVDEDARELIPDGPVHQCRRHRRVDPAGEPADHLAVSDLSADGRDLFVNDAGRGPGRLDARDVAQEALEHALPVRCVHNLRVELHPGPAVGQILESRDRRPLAARRHAEAVRCDGHAVAVAHPDRLRHWQLGEQCARLDHGEVGRTELPLPGVRHFTAQRTGHRLEPVADAEHWHSGLEQRRVDLRRAGLVHARRATGEHDRGGVAGEHLRDRHRVRNDLGVDPRLTYPTRDELRVLGAEVDHEHRTRRVHAGDPIERLLTCRRTAARVRCDMRRPTACPDPRQTRHRGCQRPIRASSRAWSG